MSGNIFELIDLIGRHPSIIRVIEEFLDKHPESVNDTRGFRTPLMLAIDMQSTELIRMILKKKPETDYVDVDENNCLMQAWKFLTDISPELVQDFLDAGFDPDVPDFAGRTLLMIVIEQRFERTAEIVSKLILAKADLNARDERGWTPLMYAVNQPGGKKIFKMLLRAGADITLTDSSGNDLFHHFRSDFNMSKIIRKMVNRNF